MREYLAVLFATLVCACATDDGALVVQPSNEVEISNIRLTASVGRVGEDHKFPISAQLFNNSSGKICVLPPPARGLEFAVFDKETRKQFISDSGPVWDTEMELDDDRNFTNFSAIVPPKGMRSYSVRFSEEYGAFLYDDGRTLAIPSLRGGYIEVGVYVSVNCDKAKVIYVKSEMIWLDRSLNGIMKLEDDPLGRPQAGGGPY